jgi:hypothetical protein
LAGYNSSQNSTYDQFNRNYNPGFFNRLLKRVSSWGMKYDDMIIKNQVSVGMNQIPSPPGQNSLYDVFSRNAISRLMDHKAISYLQQEYPEKRRILQEYATKDMIREVLTIVCDEAILYDDDDGFCRLADLPEKFDRAIREKYISNFNNIFQRFGFNSGRIPWNYFKRLMVEGFIAFEIVYDNRQRNVINLAPLDPSTIVPAIDPSGGEQIWIQFPDEPMLRRILLDSQVIYISYSNNQNYSETSYIEGLIRPYNQLTLMEQALLMFNIIHASMHKKFVIPTQGLSKQLAEEQISKLITDYKDEVTFDDTLGTVKINGSAHIPYSKEYWFPQGDSGTPSFTLETPGGINLNEDSTISWFYKKFKRASRVPLSRFDETTGGGNAFTPDAAGITREELSFFNFINRLREIFKEIMIKPVKIQMLLDFPELKDDDEFLGNINVIFNGVNTFHEIRKITTVAKRAEILSQLSTQVVDADGKAFFHIEWLVKEIMKMSDEDLGENERYKKTRATPAEAEAAGSDEGGGIGGETTTTTPEKATPETTPAPAEGATEAPPAEGATEAPAFDF